MKRLNSSTISRVSRSITAIAFLLISFAPAVLADDLSRQLHARFQGKTFFVFDFPESNTAHFNADGTHPYFTHPGSWTTSAIFIKTIHLRRDQAEFKGRRVVHLFNRAEFRFQPQRTDFDFTITIDIDRSAPEANAALLRAAAKVFIASQSALSPLVPDYWRWVFDHMDQNGELENPHHELHLQSGCRGTPTIDNPCVVGNGVIAPRRLSTPDPEYSEFARELRLSGGSQYTFVLDESGQPQKIRIMFPFGAGLDERGIIALKQWRLTPGTFNGKAVPVQMNVSMDWRLY